MTAKRKAKKQPSSSDSRAQDSKQKQKETKGRWSYAATFMQWVTKVFVAEVHLKQNEYGCVVLIVDSSKTHITLSNITESRELGVEIAVLPVHLTDVI